MLYRAIKIEMNRFLSLETHINLAGRAVFEIFCFCGHHRLQFPPVTLLLALLLALGLPFVSSPNSLLQLSSAILHCYSWRFVTVLVGCGHVLIASL